MCLIKRVHLLVKRILKSFHHLEPGLELKTIFLYLTTAIICIYGINLLVLVMETGCVDLALGTESLNAMQANFSLESAEG